jgi:hypothetical protein
MTDIPIGDLRLMSDELLTETIVRLQKQLAEANQFRDAAKMVPDAGEAWHLDEAEASLLHQLSSPDNDGDHSPLTLRVGHVRDDDGAVKFGLLCEYTEYPEEGATLLVERNAAPQPVGEAADDLIARQQPLGPEIARILANGMDALVLASNPVGEVPMPEPYMHNYPSGVWSYSKKQVQQYGEQCRAAGYAAGVAAERERCAVAEGGDGLRVLREVFSLCEDTAAKCSEGTNDFSRGRLFEAKGIARAIGTWYQDEFCGRTHMGDRAALRGEVK